MGSLSLLLGLTGATLFFLPVGVLGFVEISALEGGGFLSALGTFAGSASAFLSSRLG